MRPPWHFWLIGIASLLWHVGGAYDYVMSMTRDADYLAAMGPEMIAYLDGFSALAVSIWAISVWGALLGSVLLLARLRVATHAFWIAFAGYLLMCLRNFFLVTPSAYALGGTGIIAFSFAIGAVLLGLALYSRAMTRRGILR